MEFSKKSKCPKIFRKKFRGRKNIFLEVEKKSDIASKQKIEIFRLKPVPTRFEQSDGNVMGYSF